MCVTYLAGEFARRGSNHRNDEIELPRRRSYSACMSDLTHALIEEIKTAPEPVQREVLDFLVFLKAQRAAQTEGHEDLLALAQTAWAADWDTPEEDEAWRNL